MELYASTRCATWRGRTSMSMLEAYDLGRFPLSDLLAQQRRYLEVEAATQRSCPAPTRRGRPCAARWERFRERSRAAASAGRCSSLGGVCLVAIGVAIGYGVCGPAITAASARPLAHERMDMSGHRPRGAHGRAPMPASAESRPPSDASS